MKPLEKPHLTTDGAGIHKRASSDLNSPVLGGRQTDKGEGKSLQIPLSVLVRVSCLGTRQIYPNLSFGEPFAAFLRSQSNSPVFFCSFILLIQTCQLLL